MKKVLGISTCLAGSLLLAGCPGYTTAPTHPGATSPVCCPSGPSVPSAPSAPGTTPIQAAPTPVAPPGVNLPQGTEFPKIVSGVGLMIGRWPVNGVDKTHFVQVGSNLLGYAGTGGEFTPKHPYSVTDGGDWVASTAAGEVSRGCEPETVSLGGTSYNSLGCQTVAGAHGNLRSRRVSSAGTRIWAALPAPYAGYWTGQNVIITADQSVVGKNDNRTEVATFFRILSAFYDLGKGDASALPDAWRALGIQL